MIKKFWAAFLCAALAAACLFGCGPKNDISSGAGTKDYPVTIGQVTIGSEPTGVAVLSPNVADVILALGYEINLKAKSADCTQSDLAMLPNVTADDAEKIKSLGANLVFSDTAMTETQKSAMDKAGITVLVLNPASGRSDLQRLYSQVGSALKGAKIGYEKGKALAEGILETIDDITRVIPESNTPVTAAYLYDAAGAAATGDTFQGNLLEAAGLVNVADGGTNGKYSIRDLLISNPKYIFCAKGVKEELSASTDYKKLAAVQGGRSMRWIPA